jgi:hypothetical protein
MFIAKYRWLFAVAAAWVLSGANVFAQPSCIWRNPQLTDSNITIFTNLHYACNNLELPKRNKLFVFLPGTGGTPFFYQEIVRAAANLGFHSIGLMYVNPTSIVELCAFSLDADCNEDARLEVIDGTDRTTKVNVNRVNSIEYRIIKMLESLDQSFPAQQWDQFLVAQTNIVWSNVVISGHSQGGGHAALIAKTKPVFRCVMFASMDWRFVENAPPTWVGNPGVTPPERYIALGHYDDPTVASNRIVANWEAMELDNFGPQHLVDLSAPPYDGSHMLMTDLPSSNPHSCMITDLAMITNSGGESVYLPVWNWMLSGPSILPVLTSSAPGVITFEARTDWRYQIQASTSLFSFVNAGSMITGANGTVTANVGQVNSDFIRVQVGY